MTEAQARISGVYLGAFTDPSEWTVEQHVAGLQAVFLAGVDLGKRAPAPVPQNTEETER